MLNSSCRVFHEDPGTITGHGHIAGVSPFPRTLREVTRAVGRRLEQGRHALHDGHGLDLHPRGDTRAKATRCEKDDQHKHERSRSTELTWRPVRQTEDDRDDVSQY